VTTRRDLIAGLGALVASAAGLGGYGLLLAPNWLTITRYQVRPAAWPQDLALKIAVLADIHACDPWMTLDHIAAIVETTNALSPDMTVLLGDYVAGHRMAHRPIPPLQWARILSQLRAPLGVHAVLGNHDWWQDEAAQEHRRGPVAARRVLEACGIPVYENDAARVVKDGRSLWVAGLGDQWAFYYARDPSAPADRFNFLGVHDLQATLDSVSDDGPILLLAHEPDIFPKVPDRVALTLCGHTHGGQVRLFGYSPAVPSRFGSRYRYGHVVEQGRHLIVSAGLGCSGYPVRFGTLPEIVLVDVSA
jgi:uncharacterized protein